MNSNIVRFLVLIFFGFTLVSPASAVWSLDQKDPLDPIYNTEWNTLIQHASSLERVDLDPNSNVLLNTGGRFGIGVENDDLNTLPSIKVDIDGGYVRIRELENCKAVKTDENGVLSCVENPQFISDFQCSNGQILRFNGNIWECAVPPSGGGGGAVAVITSGAIEGDGLGTSTAIRAPILDELIDNLGLCNGDTQKLVWNGDNFACGIDQNSGGGGSGGGTISSIGVANGLTIVSGTNPITSTGVIAIDYSALGLAVGDCNDPTEKLLWDGSRFTCGTDLVGTGGGNAAILGEKGVKVAQQNGVSIVSLDMASACVDGEKLFWDGVSLSCRDDLNTGGGISRILIDGSIFSWERINTGEEQLTLRGFEFANQAPAGSCIDSPGRYKKINWNGAEFVCQPDVTAAAITDDGEVILGNSMPQLFPISSTSAGDNTQRTGRTPAGITAFSVQETFDRGTLAGEGNSDNPLRLNIEDGRDGQTSNSRQKANAFGGDDQLASPAFLSGCRDGYHLVWDPYRENPADATQLSPAFVCKPKFFTDDGDTVEQNTDIFEIDPTNGNPSDIPIDWDDSVTQGTLAGQGSGFDPLRLNIVDNRIGGTINQYNDVAPFLDDDPAYTTGCAVGYDLKWDPTDNVPAFRCMPVGLVTDDRLTAGTTYHKEKNPFPNTNTLKVDDTVDENQGTLAGIGALTDPYRLNILDGGGSPYFTNFAYDAGCDKGYILRWDPNAGIPAFRCLPVGLYTDDGVVAVSLDTDSRRNNSLTWGTLVGGGTDADPFRVNIVGDKEGAGSDTGAFNEGCAPGFSLRWIPTNSPENTSGTSEYRCAPNRIFTDDDTDPPTFVSGHEAELTIRGDGTSSDPLRVPLSNGAVNNFNNHSQVVPTCNPVTHNLPQKITWNGTEFVCEDEKLDVVTDYITAGAPDSHDLEGAIIGDGSPGNPLGINGITLNGGVGVIGQCATNEKLTWTGTQFACAPESGSVVEGSGGNQTRASGLLLSPLATGGNEISVSAPECDFVTGKLLWRAGQGFICANDQGSAGNQGFPAADTGVLSITAGPGLAADGEPFRTILEEGTLSINAPECSNDEHKLLWNGQNFECSTDAMGVERIIAGENISIISTNNDGTGEVTINAAIDGSFAVQSDDSLSGDGTLADPLSVNFQKVQARISPTTGCEPGSTIQNISQDGTLTCSRDRIGVEEVDTGPGLTGGPINEQNPRGTIFIDGPLNCWGPDKKLLWTGSMFICGNDRDTVGWGTQIVETDITLNGDGTINNPLSINVQVDDRTPISGNGTVQNPLKVDIITDNQTVLGDGTQQDPLRANFDSGCWTQDSQKTMTTCLTNVGIGTEVAEYRLHINDDDKYEIIVDDSIGSLPGYNIPVGGMKVQGSSDSAPGLVLHHKKGGGALSGVALATGSGAGQTVGAFFNTDNNVAVSAFMPGSTFFVTSGGSVSIQGQGGVVDVEATEGIGIRTDKALHLQSRNNEVAIFAGPKTLFHMNHAEGTSLSVPSGKYFNVVNDGSFHNMHFQEGDLTVSKDVIAARFLYSSDENLKQNIETLQNSLDDILALRGVEFEWKENGEKDLGLIAQEVEEIFPELVSENSQNGTKVIDYAGIIAPLVEAMKEQQDEIEALRKEVENLKK